MSDANGPAQLEFDLPNPARPVSLPGPCHGCGSHPGGTMYGVVYEALFQRVRSIGKVSRPAGAKPVQLGLPLDLPPVTATASPRKGKPPVYDTLGNFIAPPPERFPAGNEVPRPLCYECTREVVVWMASQGMPVPPGYEWATPALSPSLGG